jgi:hypothetical protein
MSKKSRTSTHVTPATTSEESVFTAEAYVASVMARLNGPLDAIALDVITRLGVFAAEDPGLLNQLIIESDPEPDEDSRYLEAQQRAQSGATEDNRFHALCDMESIEFDRQERLISTAYLLGIAVGRRLGAGALQPAAAWKSTARDDV